MTTVALLGLGNMGLAAADRLLDAGHPLAVWNRSPGRDDGLLERGASRLGAPADALAQADVCITTLGDDDAVEAVTTDVLAGARPGAALVEMSTTSVAASARVAEEAATRDVDYLRAPFSGNPTAVRSGTASIFTSGDAAVAQRLEPLLQAIAPTVRYVGEGERARSLKLVLNILIGGTAALLAEALTLGEAAGLERAQILAAVNASAAGSPFVAYKTEPLLRDDYSATFTTAMMRKDVDLLFELAGDTGAELPLTARLRSLLDTAIERGYADEDFIALVKVLEEAVAT